MCRKMSMAGFNVKSLAGGIERYKGIYITAWQLLEQALIY